MRSENRWKIGNSLGPILAEFNPCTKARHHRVPVQFPCTTKLRSNCEQPKLRKQLRTSRGDTACRYSNQLATNLIVGVALASNAPTDTATPAPPQVQFHTLRQRALQSREPSASTSAVAGGAHGTRRSTGAFRRFLHARTFRILNAGGICALAGRVSRCGFVALRLAGVPLEISVDGCRCFGQRLDGNRSNECDSSHGLLAIGCLHRTKQSLAPNYRRTAFAK